MKKMSLLLAVIFVALTAASAQTTTTPATSQPTTTPTEATGMPRKDRLERRKAVEKKAMKELDLTEEQKATVKAENEAFRERAKTIKNDPNLGKEEKKATVKELNKERRSKVEGSLNAEQKTKLEQMRAKRKQTREARKGE